MEAKNETGKNHAGAQSSAKGATLSAGLCTWTRSFDGHFNISCADQTGERANGNFKGKKDGATWEFLFCPYCGNEIEISA